MASCGRSVLANCLLALLISMSGWAQANPSRLVNPPSVLLGVSSVQLQTTPITPYVTGGLNFAKAVNYGAGGYFSGGIAVADVNGDGKLDLVASDTCLIYTALDGCAGNGGVGVLLGNGDGTFQAPVTYDSGGVVAGSVVVADVNGDGKLDLLVVDSCLNNNNFCFTVTSNTGGVGVLLGNGDGTFQTAVTYGSGGYFAGSLAVADVNGDGKPDLLVSNACLNYSSGCYSLPNGAGGVGVLLGNGDGTFKSAVIYASGAVTTSVAVADVNGDGKPDLLVTNKCFSATNCPNGFGPGGVAVLLGNGNGTFQIPMSYDSGGALALGIAIADVNADDKLDLMVLNDCISTISCEGGVGVLFGNGDGTFQAAVNYGSGADSADSLALADVNGDGKLDVVVGHAQRCCDQQGLLSVLLGNGDGSFQTGVIYESGGTDAGWVTVADVNGDSKPDILVGDCCLVFNGHTNYPSATVAVLLNKTSQPTTTAISTSGSPSILNQPVTFTATVSSKNGPPRNGETVTFYDGSTQIGTGTTSNGVATFTTSSLSVGAHTIKAAYPGDSFFQPSSHGVTQVVQKYPTNITVSSSPNPSNYGQAVLLTAVVSSSGGNIPTGNVTFRNGTTSLGTSTLNSTGTATLSTAKLPVGSDSLTATYNGDSQDANSTSSVVLQMVNQAQVKMTLSSTPNPSTFGKSVKFTATLVSNGSLPNGQQVTFSYNGSTLGTATISGGRANFSTTTLPVGSDLVTANYAGDENYGAASAQTTQTVN